MRASVSPSSPERAVGARIPPGGGESALPACGSAPWPPLSVRSQNGGLRGGTPLPCSAFSWSPAVCAPGSSPSRDGPQQRACWRIAEIRRAADLRGDALQAHAPGRELLGHPQQVGRAGRPAVWVVREHDVRPARAHRVPQSIKRGAAQIPATGAVVGEHRRFAVRDGRGSAFGRAPRGCVGLRIQPVLLCLPVHIDPRRAG